MGWAALTEAIWGSGGWAARGRGVADIGDGGFNLPFTTITPQQQQAKPQLLHTSPWSGNPNPLT